MADTNNKPTATLEEQFKALTEEHAKVVAQLATYKYAITAEAITAIEHPDVKTAEDLEKLVLDIQDHDRLKTTECIASLLVMGAVARKRSIEYSAKTKRSKDLSERMDRYNAWARVNPAQALNPAVNTAMQYAFGVIDKAQHDALMAALNGAQSSVATKEIAVEKKSA